MEVRAFFGRLVSGDLGTEPMTLQVILSTGGGITSGSGDFEVPLALVGFIREEEPLVFRTEAGEEFTVLVRDFDIAEGRAYFLTEGDLPAGRAVKVA